jgi:hypothetical protein
MLAADALKLASTWASWAAFACTIAAFSSSVGYA